MERYATLIHIACACCGLLGQTGPGSWSTSLGGSKFVGLCEGADGLGSLIEATVGPFSIFL